MIDVEQPQHPPHPLSPEAMRVVVRSLAAQPATTAEAMEVAELMALRATIENLFDENITAEYWRGVEYSRIAEERAWWFGALSMLTSAHYGSIGRRNRRSARRRAA